MSEDRELKRKYKELEQKWNKMKVEFRTMRMERDNVRKGVVPSRNRATANSRKDSKKHLTPRTQESRVNTELEESPSHQPNKQERMAMADFQIFSKVPAPPQKRGPGFAVRESKYPFDKLDVDDVLVIPGTSSKNFGPTVRAAEQRLSGFYFTVRTGPVSVKDESGADVEVVPAGAVGVWRIASKAPRKPQKARSAEDKAAATAKAQATRLKNKQAKNQAAT